MKRKMVLKKKIKENDKNNISEENLYDVKLYYQTIKGFFFRSLFFLQSILRKIYFYIFLHGNQRKTF